MKILKEILKLVEKYGVKRLVDDHYWIVGRAIREKYGDKLTEAEAQDIAKIAIAKFLNHIW